MNIDDDLDASFENFPQHKLLLQSIVYNMTDEAKSAPEQQRLSADQKWDGFYFKSFLDTAKVHDRERFKRELLVLDLKRKITEKSLEDFKLLSRLNDVKESFSFERIFGFFYASAATLNRSHLEHLIEYVKHCDSRGFEPLAFQDFPKLIKTITASNDKNASDFLIDTSIEPEYGLKISWDGPVCKVEERLCRKSLTIPNTENNPDAGKLGTLLDWRCSLTDLIGRGPQLKQLKDWLNFGADISVFCIYGDAGTGKSRLAFHFAKYICRSLGWAAGMLNDNRSLQGDWKSGENGIVLVIDSPEENYESTGQFLSVVNNLFLKNVQSLRILMLCRNREYLKTLSAKAPSLEYGMMGLGGLETKNDEWDLVNATWDRLRKLSKSNVRLPDIEKEFFEWKERNNHHSSPLMIIALTIYLFKNDQSFEKSFLELNSSTIFRYFSIQEEQKILGEIEAYNILHSQDIEPESLMLLKAMAAIVNGFDDSTLRNLHADLKNAKEVDSQLPSVKHIKKTSMWQGEILPPLAPDLLAADFLDYCLDKHAKNQEATWVFTVTGLNRLVSGDIDDQRTIRVFSGLGRLLHDITKLYSETKSSSKREGIIIEALCSELVGNPSYCIWISDHLGTLNMEPSLRPLIMLALSQGIAHVSDLRTKAYYRKHLATQKISRGDSSALSDIKDSVDTYTKLSMDYPMRFNEELAAALVDQARILGALNANPKDLLNSARRAEIIYENLNQKGAEFNKEFYATCLNNLAIGYYKLGDTDKAINKVNRAFEVYLNLAHESDHSHFIPDLARAALNASTFLLQSEGREHDALETIKFAEETYRKLSNLNFDIYGNSFAEALNNKSVILAKIGKDHRLSDVMQQALESGVESVSLFNRIKINNPDIDLLGLSRALTNLSDIYFGINEVEDGLIKLKDALKVIDPLAKECFQYYGSELTLILSTLSNRNTEAGNKDEAIKFRDRAKEISEALRLNKPYPFLGKDTVVETM